MPSREILDALMAVERRAKLLVDEATLEGDRRVAAAKEASELRFKSGFETASRQLTDTFVSIEAAERAKLEVELNEYRSRLEGLKLDDAAFRKACERAFIGSL